MHNGIIVAICKHIASLYAGIGGTIYIRINEPTNGGIIVSALEVVEPGFLVVDIPTVAQRVDICQRAGCGDDLPVGVIVVACDNVLAGVHNPHHVPLQVGDVVVRRAVVLHGVGCTIGIIEEVNGIGSPGHAHQPAAGIIIAVRDTIYRLAGSQVVCIVGKAQAVGSVGGRRQTPAILPRHCPPGAVAVAGGIANGIVGDGFSVIGGQNIVYGVMGRQGSGCRWNKYTIDLRCWQYLIIPLDFEKKPWNPRIPGLVS